MTIRSLAIPRSLRMFSLLTTTYLTVHTDVLVAATALGLKDFLNAAMTKNETSRINQTQKDQFAAKKDEAGATMMPQFKAIGAYVRQDVSQNSNINANSKSAKLNLTQPILGLYKNRSAVDYAQSQLDAIGYSGDDAVLQVKLSINDAFHSVLAAMSEVQTDEQVKDIADKRVKEVNSRVKIGRSRAADLYAAQAQLANAEAGLEQAKATEVNARNLLSQLSGLPAETAIADSTALPDHVDSVDRYVSAADALPGIRYLNAQRNATDLQIKSIRDQRLPDLDFVANYYLRRDEPLDNVKWDVGVQLTWAIYDGGLISAKVRESQAINQMYGIEADQKRRVVDLKIRQSYDQYVASLKQIPILEKSLNLAQKSYDAIEKDYRLGLTTILEVIQSYNTVSDAKRLYSHQLITAKSSLAALQLNAGQNL